jgi:hypothetical protein
MGRIWVLAGWKNRAGRRAGLSRGVLETMMVAGSMAWPSCSGFNHRQRENPMDQTSTEERAAAGTRKIDVDTYKLWHEKPVGKFCLGFSGSSH